MRETGTTRIGRGPILVGVLAVAAIVGWGIGALAGGVSRPQATVAPSPKASPTASPASSPTATPIPTGSYSVSAGPNVSAAPVIELSGTGNKISADFDVLVGWQIQWQTDADHIVIAVRGDSDLGKVVDVPGPASGIASPPHSGKFHVEITAKGPWSIKVIQGTG